MESLRCPGGIEINLWDIQYLYEQTSRLPRRQRQAIQLCLVENRKEVDAAIIMGVSPTNPVAMYATSGIAKLLIMIDEGKLERFQPPTVSLPAVEV